MAEIRDSQIWLVRYIFLHRASHGRFDIDKNLINLNYDALEIEKAWEVILSGKHRAFLEGDRGLTFDQKLSHLILYIVCSCGLFLTTLFCIFCLVGITQKQNLPSFLAISLIL
jgi:hypothetical protein